MTYTRKDAADALGVSLRTVDRLLATGELAYSRIRGRVVVRSSDVDALLRRKRERRGLGTTAADSKGSKTAQAQGKPPKKPRSLDEVGCEKDEGRGGQTTTLGREVGDAGADLR